MMRIELTQAILDHPFAHVCIFGNIFPESRFRCYAGYKMYQRCMFQFIPILLEKGDEIVRACDLHSNETVTLLKHVTKYKNIRNWTVEFLRKSENRGDKIVPVNSIHQIYQFTLILHGVGVRSDVDILT